MFDIRQQFMVMLQNGASCWRRLCQPTYQTLREHHHYATSEEACPTQGKPLFWSEIMSPWHLSPNVNHVTVANWLEAPPQHKLGSTKNKEKSELKLCQCLQFLSPIFHNSFKFTKCTFKFKSVFSILQSLYFNLCIKSVWPPYPHCPSQTVTGSHWPQKGIQQVWKIAGFLSVLSYFFPIPGTSALLL